jgi:NHL repeat-containing protein
MIRGLNFSIALATAVVLASAVDTSGASATALLRLAASRHLGWQVNPIRGGNVCVVLGIDECRHGMASVEPGGFQYPSSLAVDPNTGSLFVADTTNSRVQKFTADDAFLAMFGWNVNKTKSGQSTTRQSERDVCTAVSRDVCGAGTPGMAAGQLHDPFSLTVDPLTGDVYILEVGDNMRLDKYTADGRFVWMIGKDVNATTKGSVCLASELARAGVRCSAGTANATDSIEPEAFKPAQQYGDLLAMGGPEDLLYVGDEHRVQEMDSEGRWRREILLTSLSARPASDVTALTVDTSGDVYLVYDRTEPVSGADLEATATIRKFDAKGNQEAAFPIASDSGNATVHVDGLALGPNGLLAVIGVEIGFGTHVRFGRFYKAKTGRMIGAFVPPPDNDGLTFDAMGNLYVAATDSQEVTVYAPRSSSSLTSGLAQCEATPGRDDAGTVNCILNGSG